MFKIYCKAIKDHDKLGINKGGIYKGTFDETKDNFCVPTPYDTLICGTETFKAFFRIICGTKI